MSVSNEVMTKEEAFDVYVRRRVKEHTDYRRHVDAIVSHDARTAGTAIPSGQFAQAGLPKKPAPIERDVEIRAIQLGIWLTDEEKKSLDADRAASSAARVARNDRAIELMQMLGGQKNGNT